MTYKQDKKCIISQDSNTSSQSISTTYIPVTGSSVNLNLSRSIDVLYKLCFYSYNSDSNSQFLHCKLQKSNDNFSSDIEDIQGCQMNISGNELVSGEKLYTVVNLMFIAQNLNKSYLRACVRSYSSSNKATLHRSTQFDGSTSADVYFNVNLFSMEL
jgi:hypothetical protein